MTADEFVQLVMNGAANEYGAPSDMILGAIVRNALYEVSAEEMRRAYDIYFRIIQSAGAEVGAFVANAIASATIQGAPHSALCTQIVNLLEVK